MSAKLVLFSIIFLFPLTFFSECRKKEDVNPGNNNEMTKVDSEISYLALGDSYTKAECEVSGNSYPAQLSKKFLENGIKTNYKIIAQTGWRTDDLKNAINNASLQDTFDIVSLLIGVNNQYQGRSAANYKIEFLDLLETAIYYAQGRKDKVFVISIPDYGMTPFGSSNQAHISEEIDIFNEINKEISDSVGVRYFDITPISREAKTDASLTCTDNLHPSGKMYGRWVELMLPKLLKMVAKP